MRELDGEHDGQHDRERDVVDVVVIGAGLAGLTAAATAARAGRSVTVVEAGRLGGRARTDEYDGYRFSQGPHALCIGGAAWRILRDLGVPHHGHRPPVRGARLLRAGTLVRPPAGRAARLVGTLLATSPGSWAGRSAQAWIESLGGGRARADLLRAMIRVTSYVTDVAAMPADFAIARLKAASRGVSYLDGGFGTLATGLAAVASSAGAVIREHQPVTGIGGAHGSWKVALASGEELCARAVVLACGGPAVVRHLLPSDPGWTGLGRPVTAACLDLGLRGPTPSVVVGTDEPVYLARHSPPGGLAPRGGSVVHAMRYGARDPRADRAALRRLARLAGIRDHQIVQERFLAEHVVTHVLPSPAGGLASRPGVTSSGAAGIYLAGDWVGPTGWLSDAAMASGQRAGLLAADTADAAASRRTPRAA